jgi:O-antigen/teichoic acid export membrane protein
MESPIRRLLATLRDRSPLPDGTTAIGTGLVVNGIATYAFLVIARRSLGDEAYGGLAVLWGLIYILGPGLFQPLEQELARATANRSGRGEGSAPVFRQAARIGSAQLAIVIVLVLVAWPLGLDELLDDRIDLLAALVLSLAAFMMAECVRGVLSGRHEFGRYGAYFAAEGMSRLILAGVLAVIGVEVVGAFAMSVGVAFVIATFVGVGTLRPFVKPGPPAPLAELTPSLGWLLIASLGEAFMLNVGPVALDIVGKDLGEEAPGVFLNGLIISRVPLFFFQAVKAALLPNLARQASENDLTSFRDTQLRLVSAVISVAAISIVLMALIGPWLVESLFGDEIGALDMALLSASGGGLMVMVSLSLGLIALNHTHLAVAGFVVGVAVFPVALLFANEPFLQVETALVAAVTAGSLITAVLLKYEYGVHTRSGRLPQEPVATQ